MKGPIKDYAMVISSSPLEGKKRAEKLNKLELFKKD
jgi:hypothetical protein